jgi:hypothetical protein
MANMYYYNFDSKKVLRTYSKFFLAELYLYVYFLESSSPDTKFAIYFEIEKFFGKKIIILD